MSGYTKLFSDIVLSTIWQESAHVKIVWITMLALRNKRHQIMASIPGLADAAHVTLEQCEESLTKLMSPDKYSRSKAMDGRRIFEVDGGWQLVNGEKYRQMLSLDERREYQRIKQAEYRKKSTSVNKCKHLQISQRFTESESESESESEIGDKNKITLKSNGSIRAVIGSWMSLYEAFYEKEYFVVPGKDHKTAKRLLAKYTPDELEDLFANFMKSDIPKRLGASLSIFASMINQVSLLKGATNDNSRTR